jgi:beta-glucuronidase
MTHWRPVSAGRREPAGTAVRTVDGVPVVFQYEQPVPSFDVRADVPPERDYLELDGRWRFAFDPGDVGTGDGWMRAGFDDDRWQDAEVPLPWDLYDTAGFGSYDGSSYGTGTAFRDGYAWYRVGFGAPGAWAGRFVKICFLGVNYAASVYLNGALVAEHEGGHTPFAVDATPVIRPGAVNLLAVRVYRRPWYRPGPTGPEAISCRTELPHKPVDYWPYAGLTREVFIEATAQVTLSKLITSARDGRLAAAAVVFNHGAGPARRRLTLDPGAGTGGAPVSRELALAPGEVRVVSAELPIPGARSWSPADPRLYRLTARLEADGAVAGDADETGRAADGLAARYGMRAVEVMGGRLCLNGEPVFLKGLNWHEETPERGRTMHRPDYDELLRTAAGLGANFLRNCGYTRHPDFYRAADEHGMLVCDETDNFWVESGQQQIQGRYGLSAALVAAMVWNQVNHACVALWSLQNESETTDRATYRTWISQLRDAARIDPQQRPVTWASSTSWDPAFDLADVIGFNEYFGYFYGRDADLGRTLDAVHRRYPGAPILITENGSWADLGRHGSPAETGTEEWQADKLRQHWRQVTARAGYLAGYTYWLLKDYKQRMDYNHHLNGISAMGLITFAGHRRAAYAAFRDCVNPSGAPGHDHFRPGTGET